MGQLSRSGRGRTNLVGRQRPRACVRLFRLLQPLLHGEHACLLHGTDCHRTGRARANGSDPARPSGADPGGSGARVARASFATGRFGRGGR